MEQYIPKSVLVAEIKRRIVAHKETLKNCDSSISEMVLKGSMGAYQSLLHFLNTIDVKKDVDLKEDVDRILYENDWDYDEIDFYEFAKYFFELGLKTKKGE